VAGPAAPTWMMFGAGQVWVVIGPRFLFLAHEAETPTYPRWLGPVRPSRS